MNAKISGKFKGKFYEGRMVPLCRTSANGTVVTVMEMWQALLGATRIEEFWDERSLTS